MANEFIARNGITSLGNIVVSGSLTTTGAITISGSIASASFATNAATASSADNLLVRSTLTAQTLVVQTITSSVDFVTGSTQFGTLLTNTHVFSGSVTMNPNGLFVSSSGNVGIGNINPLSKLDVTVLASGARRLLINYDDSLVTIKSANASATAESLRVWGDNIYFYTGSAGSELMRLTNTGRVGIGTTSLSYAKFNVYNNTNDATYNVRIQAVFGNSDYLGSDGANGFGSGASETQFLNGSSTRPAIISLGGSLSTDEALGAINFFRSGNTDTYRTRVTITGVVQSTGTAGQHGGYLSLRTAADSQTNPSERVRITSDGAMYMSRISSDLTFADSVGGMYVRQNGNPAGTQEELRLFGRSIGLFSHSGTRYVTITSDNRVGIGTSTPSGSRLHVFIGNDGGSGTPGTILATSNGVNDIVRFQDGTTTVAAVKNGGGVVGANFTSTTSYSATAGQAVIGVSSEYGASSWAINLASVFTQYTFSSRGLSVQLQILGLSDGSNGSSVLANAYRSIGGTWVVNTVNTAQNGTTFINSITASGTTITINWNTTAFGCVNISIINRA